MGQVIPTQRDRTFLCLLLCGRNPCSIYYYIHTTHVGSRHSSAALCSWTWHISQSSNLPLEAFDIEYGSYESNMRKFPVGESEPWCGSIINTNRELRLCAAVHQCLIQKGTCQSDSRRCECRFSDEAILSLARHIDRFGFCPRMTSLSWMNFCHKWTFPAAIIIFVIFLLTLHVRLFLLEVTCSRETSLPQDKDSLKMTLGEYPHNTKRTSLADSTSGDGSEMTRKNNDSERTQSGQNLVTLEQEATQQISDDESHGKSPRTPHCDETAEISDDTAEWQDDENSKQFNVTFHSSEKPHPQKNSDVIISVNDLKESLRLIHNGQELENEHLVQQLPDKPKKAEDCDESESEDEDSTLRTFYRSRLPLAAGVREVITCTVRRDENMREELARYGSYDVSRSDSGRQWLSRLEQSGVWIWRLAQAGFYRPHEHATTLRCAFCGVEVQDQQLRETHKTPMDLHRELSPNCSIVTSPDSVSMSSSSYHLTRGQQYQQAMFDDSRRVPLQSDSAGSDSGINQNLQPTTAESSTHTGAISDTGCSANLALPPLMPAPPRLPAAVDTDGQESGPTTLQQVAAPPPPPPTQSPGASGEAVGALQVPASNTTHPSPSIHPTSHHMPQTQVPSHSNQGQSSPDTVTAEAAATERASHEPATVTRSPEEPADDRHQHPSPSSSPPQQQAPTSTAAPGPPRQVVTYGQLGIFTQNPKRQDMVLDSTRRNTFTGWPHSHTHSADHMAEAGFYYTGHGDLVRCFYCKGGLKSWAEHLRPWVEHARFFPECPYVQQVKGHAYVEVVKDLHEKQERVSEDDVKREVAKTMRAVNQPVEDDAGAAWMEEGGAVGGAVGGVTKNTDSKSRSELEEDGEAELGKRMEELENENQEAKEERICKICQSHEVSILFLPCGHLVSCAHCAPALRTCAICRQRVKGRVRVYMDEEEG